MPLKANILPPLFIDTDDTLSPRIVLNTIWQDGGLFHIKFARLTDLRVRLDDGQPWLFLALDLRPQLQVIKLARSQEKDGAVLDHLVVTPENPMFSTILENIEAHDGANGYQPFDLIAAAWQNNAFLQDRIVATLAHELPAITRICLAPGQREETLRAIGELTEQLKVLQEKVEQS